MTQAYLFQIGEMLARNHGRLLLADEKTHAAESLVAALFADFGNSFLYITEDAETAAQIAALIPVQTTVIDSFEQFCTMLPCPAQEAAEADTHAFLQQYPRLVIAAQGRDGALLHRKLCADESKNGIYFQMDESDEQADYCVSDYLAECRYPLVVFDRFYSLIAFCQYAPESAPDPAKYDRIEFLGKTYYTDKDHSFRRLKKIAGVAEKCVVVTDVIAETDILPLYAAIELITDPFSFLKERDAVRGQTASYEDSCDFIYNDINNCKRDEGILSDCVQCAAVDRWRLPCDIESMGNFLEESLKYLSMEEVFLKALYAFRTERGGNSPEEVIEQIESDMQEMAVCLNGMFIRDPLKKEIEGKLKTARMSAMSAEEIAFVTKLFLRYGLIYAEGTVQPFEIMRIYREDSAFEQFVRGHIDPAEGEYAYSTLSIENSYKEIATARLIEGKERFSAGQPVLVVTADGNSENTAGRVRAYLKSNAYVTYLGFDDLRKTAQKASFRTAIFYDFPRDIFLLARLIAKAGSFGARVILLADYDDLSGQLLDRWKPLLMGLGTIPFSTDEIMLGQSGGKSCAEMLSGAEKLYQTMKKLTMGQIDDLGEAQERPAAQTEPDPGEVYEEEDAGETEELSAAQTEPAEIPEEEDIEKIIQELFGVQTEPNSGDTPEEEDAGETEELFTVQTEPDSAETSAEENIGKITQELSALLTRFNPEETLTMGDISRDIHFFSFTSQSFAEFFRNTASIGGAGQKIEGVYYENGVKRVGRKVDLLFFNICARQLLHHCDYIHHDCNGCPNYELLRVNSFDSFGDHLKQFFAGCYSFADWLEEEKNSEKVLHGAGDEGEDINRFRDEISKEKYLVERLKVTLDSKMAGMDGPVGLEFADVKKIMDAVMKIFSSRMEKYYRLLLSLIDRTAGQISAFYQTVYNTLKYSEQR